MRQTALKKSGLDWPGGWAGQAVLRQTGEDDITVIFN
jgi:hypothetical protein